MPAGAANRPLLILQVGVATVFSSIVALPAAAQSAQQLEQRAYVDQLCKTSLDLALKRIRPFLSDSPLLQKKPDLAIIAPFIELNAFALYQQQRIVLTTGLCDQLFLMSRAMLLNYLYKLPTGPLLRYVDYLGGKTLAIERAATPGQYTKYEVLPFELHAKLDLSKLTDENKWVSQRVIEDEIPNMMMAIVGHELGHLTKGHRPYTEISASEARKQEYAADAFAYELVTKIIGSSPDPTLFSIPLLLFSARERIGPAIAEGTHPRGECRIVRLLDQSGILDTFASDPARSKEYLEKTGISVSDTRKAVVQGLKACAE